MRRLLGRLGWIIAAVVLLVVAAVAIALWVSRPPDATAFYDPPDVAADAAPGTLLRSEDFDGTVPDGARAWRILYTSPGADDRPVVVSGLVLADPSRGGDGPRPVVAWQHGAIGIERGCAPSLLDDPRLVLGQSTLTAMLARGWVVVATDYPGLGGPGPHPFLAGEVTGRSVLDAVRAARQLDTGLDLGTRYALMGESQGGHASLFAGRVATTGYAPELQLVGVAVAAPATDLGPLLEAAGGTTPGKLLTSQALVAWTGLYPELSFEEAVRPIARPVVRAIADRCLYPNIAVVAAATLALPDDMLAIDLTTDPRWSRRIAQNTPAGAIDVPVLLVQGQRDKVVAPAVQRRWVAARCAAGQAIDLRELPDSGHVDVMVAAGPILEGWTARLLAGRAVPPGCATG